MLLLPLGTGVHGEALRRRLHPCMGLLVCAPAIVRGASSLSGHLVPSNLSCTWRPAN